MVTLFRPPSPVLEPFVDVLWYMAQPLPPGRERTLPSGSMQLVVNLAEDAVRWYDGDRLDTAHQAGGAVLCGAVSRAVGIDTADRADCLGVAFRPGGALPFFAPPASALVEPVVALDDLWGAGSASLRDRLLQRPSPQDMLNTIEAVLLEHVVRPFEPDPSVTAAASALERGLAVARVADDLSLATSTFHRRFRDTIGLSPKVFGRVRRLQRVVSGVNAGDDVDWAGVAAMHGYVDQAHLINEFRHLTGLTPGQYRPRAAEPNHVPMSPAR